MASLTETAIIARKTIRYSIYGIILILIIRSSVRVGTRLYRQYFPEPPPEPTVAFGKLPELPFPDTGDYGDYILTLETPEGSLPSFQQQAKVYFMPKASVNIRSLERAFGKASALGFITPGNKETATIYTFTKDNSPAILNMNIVTNVFSIDYDLSQDPSLRIANAPVPGAAISSAKGYLAHAGLLEEDMSGPDKHELLKVVEGDFVRAISLSEANFIKVNLFRKDYEDIPSFTPSAIQGNIWFIVGPSGSSGTILVGEYHYFPISEDRAESYPLKTVQQAWEELKAGKGYVANIGENEGNAEIKIRRVYLGYYDSGIYMEFYQPIYVFEGDDEFFAYVPAIASNYYGSDTETSTQE